MVVTDAHVDECHGDKVMGLLGPDWGKIVLPSGYSS